MKENPGFVLAHANVITMDPDLPRGDFVTVRNDRIESVGCRDDSPDLKNTGYKMIDCQGMTLMPGFNDAHLHFLALVSSFEDVDCSRQVINSIGDIQKAIKGRATSVPSGRWIRARGYDESFLAERRHPCSQELDLASPDNPVRLDHISGHALVLNSRALKTLGISRNTPDPLGSVIVRDETTMCSRSKSLILLIST